MIDHWVYVLINASCTAAKIGRCESGDVIAKRCMQLQTGNPERIDVFATLNPTQHTGERDLHQHFHNYRMHGEWFRIDGAILEWMQSLSPDSIEIREHLDRVTATEEWKQRRDFYLADAIQRSLLADQLAHLRSARDALQEAEQQYEQTIVRAYQNGHSYRTIASVTNVSHQTVANIIAKHRAGNS